jgi:hypothetical protein
MFIDVLKCCRSASSITYLEGNAVVTHGEVIFEDLK